MDVIALTQKLLSFDTINPPGSERAIAEYIGGLLTGYGFKISYPQFTETRWNVIAEYPGKGAKPPLVLSGHLDTVPLGDAKWEVDPFCGVVKDGKLYGRGSSDMKGADAAMITAAIRVAEFSAIENGLKLVFTAAEERGCEGVRHLFESGFDLGKISAVIIGEPTANIPAIGHKGALFMYARTSGVTAHSSMPQEGDNAIYKAARAVSKIENFSFDSDNDPLLGVPTINVGMIKGGLNANSVPDFAEFTIDVRSTGKNSHAQIMERLQQCFGGEVSLESFVDLGPVVTVEDDPFIQTVYKISGFTNSNPKILPYMTDASVFKRYFKDVPIVILGPGEAEQAHQTNEFCYVDALNKAVELYYEIIMQWDK